MKYLICFLALFASLSVVSFSSNSEDLYCNYQETCPSFPGGDSALIRFINQHLTYPASLAENSIQGRVVLSFCVEPDGTITDIKELRSPHEALTAEAVRVIRLMPKWTPGAHQGKAVRCRYVLPVSFRYADNISTLLYRRNRLLSVLIA